jgi:hypothetical protein
MTDVFKNMLSEAIIKESNRMVGTGTIQACGLSDEHRKINADIDAEIFAKMDSLTNDVTDK